MLNGTKRPMLQNAQWNAQCFKMHNGTKHPMLQLMLNGTKRPILQNAQWHKTPNVTKCSMAQNAQCNADRTRNVKVTACQKCECKGKNLRERQTSLAGPLVTSLINHLSFKIDF